VRGIPLGVALVALGLYLVGLGAAPYLDPPEGFHAEIARAMALRDIFWDSPRLEWAWVGPGRASVRLIAQAGRRRLYSNLADRGSDVR
jgi:hypothetical protein